MLWQYQLVCSPKVGKKIAFSLTIGIYKEHFVRKLNVDKAVCLILGICVPAILSYPRNWLKSVIRQSQESWMGQRCG